MNILAINFNHDGSAVLVRDGRIAGYVNTERFSRRKKHPGVRETEIREVLDQAGLELREVDLVQLLNLNFLDSPEIPEILGSDMKETWPEFWINQRFGEVDLLGRRLRCEVPRTHHKYHLALPWCFCGFDSCVSVSVDPVGCEAVFFKNGQEIKKRRVQELSAPWVYDAVSREVFESGLIGAGKLMGLAPYGRTDVARFNFAQLSLLSPREALARLLALSSEESVWIEEGNRRYNASLAFEAQCFLEYQIGTLLIKLRNEAMILGVDPCLCLSGGTALNSSANQRCFEKSGFDKLYLHPACGDDGTAIGAALMHWHQTLKQPLLHRNNKEAMYSVRSYDENIPLILKDYTDRLTILSVGDCTLAVAKLIADGKVVGLFQGPSEIGPRSLGNRSILADPRRSDMKDYLNISIKNRERFRPFAPTVLKEHASRYFEIDDSPFMLRIAQLKSGLVPAVTHVDGTARVQTIEERDNPVFYKIIKEFYGLTNVPLLLNTSMNGKGEPISETPADAIELMLRLNLDALAFPGILVLPKRP